jgi:hypothetical protein
MAKENSANYGVLAHDEVRERAALPNFIAYEPKTHAGARKSLDPHHLGGKLEPLFARQVDRELGRRARFHLSRGPHEEPTPGHVLDEPIDHEPIDPKLRPGADWDSYGCPLVHVVKATLATHHQERNRLASPFERLSMPHRGEIAGVGSSLTGALNDFAGSAP